MAAAALLQATLDLSQDQYERAIAAAKAVNTEGVVVLARQQRSLLTSAGHAYLSAKKPLESEKVFQDLMLRYPDFAGAYYGMGRALHEQGKSKEAALALEKAYGMEASAMTLYRLGQVWQTLGEKPKAIAAFEKALAFKPEINPKARGDAEEQLKALKA